MRVCVNECVLQQTLNQRWQRQSIKICTNVFVPMCFICYRKTRRGRTRGISAIIHQMSKLGTPHGTAILSPLSPPPLLKRGSCALDELLGNTSGAAWQTPVPSESSQLLRPKRRKRKTNNTAASSPLLRKPIRLGGKNIAVSTLAL